MTEIEYLLECLGEEGVEIARRVFKIKRIGLDEREPGNDFDNRERLSGEIDDLVGVLGLLQARGVLRPVDKILVDAKQAKVAKFMEYSVKLGIVVRDWKHTLELSDQELVRCTVCDGSEGSMPTDCPLTRMMNMIEGMVMGGYMDFVDGNWVVGKKEGRYNIGGWRIPAIDAVIMIGRGSIESIVETAQYPGYFKLIPVAPPEGA